MSLIKRFPHEYFWWKSYHNSYQMQLFLVFTFYVSEITCFNCLHLMCLTLLINLTKIWKKILKTVRWMKCHCIQNDNKHFFQILFGVNKGFLICYQYLLSIPIKLSKEIKFGCSSSWIIYFWRVLALFLSKQNSVFAKKFSVILAMWYLSISGYM